MRHRFTTLCVFLGSSLLLGAACDSPGSSGGGGFVCTDASTSSFCNPDTGAGDDVAGGQDTPGPSEDVLTEDTGVCVPSCAGKTCGGDGCGGSCGGCPPNAICTPSGECAVCLPDCGGKACGGDGCGGSCGECGPGTWCDPVGQCSVVGCVPDCEGKECGSDGCGGACGSCPSPLICENAVCVYEDVPDCAGKECGPDGFGGSCGECAAGQTCNAQAQCEPVSGSGACVNDADLTIIEGTDIYGSASSCGIGCVGEQDELGCSNDCLTSQTGLSEPCATCFSARIVCAINYCIPACLTPDSPECVNCQLENCVEDFQACSGLDEPGSL